MEPESPLVRPQQHEAGPILQGRENQGPLGEAEITRRQNVEQQPKVETRENLPAPVGGDPSFAAAPIPVLPPAQSPITATAPTSSPVSDDNPIVAADEDLIEKEWVDKAKKIISTTKTDPYLQEKEISKLQADYLNKRYGKELKISTE